MADAPEPRLTPPEPKALTPEQTAAREKLAKRTERMSMNGLPQPKSGVWGGKASKK